MDFDKRNSYHGFGVALGYILGYFLFTTVMYFILTFFDKLPEYFNYFMFMLITLLVVLVGEALKRLLK